MIGPLDVALKLNLVQIPIEAGASLAVGHGCNSTAKCINIGNGALKFNETILGINLLY